MLNFGKTARLEAEVRGVQEIILAQSVTFSGSVSQKIDDTTDVKDLGKFKRIFARNDKPFRIYSHIDQMYASIEGMAFFIHCFSRLSFRAKDETLRERIFDPSVIALVELFAKMIHSLSAEHHIHDLQQDLFALISERENQYSEMPSLLGSNPEDKLSAWQEAGRIIAQKVGTFAIPALEKKVGRLAFEFLELTVRVELLRGYNEMNLAPKIKSIEKHI
jgi:hypothetical protein